MSNYLASKLTTTKPIFKTEFEDGYVVWTVLQWDEFKKLREAQSILGPELSLDIETFVYNKCVLHSSYDRIPDEELTSEEYSIYLKIDRESQLAGIISTIAKQVLDTSGALSAKRILSQINDCRTYVNNIEDQLVSLICQAFPAYKPEEVEKLDWQTVLKRAAQAEQILGIQIQLEDEEQKKKEAAQRFNLDKDIQEVARGLKGNQSQESLKKAGEAFREEQRAKRNAYLAGRGM